MSNTPLTLAVFASYFDSTNLRLDASDKDIIQLCKDAVECGFYSIMVYPTRVALCAKVLEGTNVRIGTVVGFPSGMFSTAAKEAEIGAAAELGANEVDIVMNYRSLIEGNSVQAEEEIIQLCEAASGIGLSSKIIAETCYLNKEQKIKALNIAEVAKADFIKTSTGFGSAGAQIKDIELWDEIRGPKLKIKAAGGMNTYLDALCMIQAGAGRLGASKAKTFFKAYKEVLQIEES